VRSSIESLLNLSRRRPFNRLLKLPTLFPFKRQEEIDSSAPKAKGERNGLGGGGRRRFLRSRKERMPDSQMIFINGKQFYVDDNGELKEFKGKDDSR